MSDTAVEEKEVSELTSHDRCDQCVSQAYVLVRGISGELFFCSHHFTKIERDEEAYTKLKSFAYTIQDEREGVSDKRAGV